MGEQDDFVVQDGRAIYRPVGSVSFGEAAALVRAAIEAARVSDARDLLIDTTRLSGFQSPSASERFFAVEEWAKAAKGVVPVAMILRAEMIHPQKFGVTVGTNRGFASNVFLTEAEALAWLDSCRA